MHINYNRNLVLLSFGKKTFRGQATLFSVLTELYCVGSEFTGAEKEYNDHLIEFTVNIVAYNMITEIAYR